MPPNTLATLPQLQAAVTAKLHTSALTPAHARLLGIQALLPAQMRLACPGLPVYRAGFRIPYFDMNARQTKFYRVRYLDYGHSNGFAAVVTANDPAALKQFRYGQPANTVNEIYLPPNVSMPPNKKLTWAIIAEETTIPIIITEGELKAACACAFGLPTVGLGGVWCFMSKNSELPLLPQFHLFKWTSRPVYIIYDSDTATNLEVIKAQNALAHQLTLQGARPTIVPLPALPDLKKTGLDDFLVYHNDHAPLQALWENLPPYNEAEELHRLNEEVVYVRDPGLILQLATRQRMSVRSFIEHAYADRMYTETVEIKTKDGGTATKMTDKCAPREWIKWKPRATVKSVTYLPGQPANTVDGSLNIWSGWACAPSPGNVQPWEELIGYLFTDCIPALRRWFMQWLAYPLQFPGTKLYSAVVMWGLQHGTGKSLVGYSMFKIYGPNAVEISDRDLYSTHNEWAENKQFVMGEEITGGDKRNTADHMKGMITQQRLRVNPKYIPSYTVPDCLNYYFTSNHPDAFFLEDSDRRFFIHEVRGAPQSSEFYSEYAHWLDNGGAARLFHYLLHYPLDDFNPTGHAPGSRSKSEMIVLGKSDIANWCAALRENPDSVLRLGSKVLAYSMYTTEQLLRIYDPEDRKRVSANGLAREMRRSGFFKVNDGFAVGTGHGVQKLWAVRNIEHLLAIPRPLEIADIYNTEYKIVLPAPRTIILPNGTPRKQHQPKLNDPPHRQNTEQQPRLLQKRPPSPQRLAALQRRQATDPTFTVPRAAKYLAKKEI